MKSNEVENAGCELRVAPGLDSQFATRNSRFLLIACGNPLRGDDGAGIALAERVSEYWQEAGITVELHCVQQLTPELVLSMAQPDLVGIIFFDARLAGEEDISFQESAVPSRKVGKVIDAIEFYHLAPAAIALSFAHQLQPETLLLYLQMLYHRSPPAWLVTIPCQRVAHGVALSRSVEEMLAQAPLVAQELLKLQ